MTFGGMIDATSTVVSLGDAEAWKPQKVGGCGCCQFQVLSQQLTSGAPGHGFQIGRCPPKTAHFVPQNSLFWPKIAPKPTQNGQTSANGRYSARAPRLPCDQEHFLAL